MARRVLITGIGAVSALGVGREALWRGLCEGRSGLRPIEQFDASAFPTVLGGEVREEDGSLVTARNYVPKSYRKPVKVMARDTELAVVATKLAVDQAGLVTRGSDGVNGADPVLTYAPERMGCNIGAGLIAAEAGEIAQAFDKSRSPDGGIDLKHWGDITEAGGGGGMQHLTPLWLLKYLPNMLACHVTIIHGAQGPSNTITCGEASGLLSIGESVRVIERGSAEMTFAGGAESKVNPLGVIRQGMAGRLTTASADADPASVVRPFDETSDGTIVGEGGGILILEQAKSAEARGCRGIAEVVGFGAGQSACGLPAAEGADGYRYAVEAALADAGVDAADVDAIVPLGIGEPGCDALEAIALAEVFGPRVEQIPLVTLAPAVGNCYAGMGGLAAGVGAMLLAEQCLPARLGPDDKHRCRNGLRAWKEESRPAELRHVLVTSSSLGGQNAALLLRTIST